MTDDGKLKRRRSRAAWSWADVERAARAVPPAASAPRPAPKPTPGRAAVSGIVQKTPASKPAIDRRRVDFAELPWGVKDF